MIWSPYMLRLFLEKRGISRLCSSASDLGRFLQTRCWLSSRLLRACGAWEGGAREPRLTRTSTTGPSRMTCLRVPLRSSSALFSAAMAVRASCRCSSSACARGAVSAGVAAVDAHGIP